MCGIVGYVGNSDAAPALLEGLSRLEYRGYDSAGISILAAGKITTVKRAGKLSSLVEALKTKALPHGALGIGHTRWATHGTPIDRNAHPHLDPDGKIALIHNGIIENFQILKSELEQVGHNFTSDTDSEVVAHLLGVEYAKAKDLTAAMQRVCQRLKGNFSLVAIATDSPDILVGARRNSPLVVGLGEGENFLGSDVSAFIAFTKRALEIGQNNVVTLSATSYSISNFDGGQEKAREFEVTWDASAAEKNGFPHFMAKEIMEQPKALADCLLGRLDERGHLTLNEIRVSDDELRDIDKVIIIGCGSAYHAGMIAKHGIEHWSRLPVEVELASEFRYRDPIITRSTLVIAISQSGETMDTLMALRHAKEQRAKVISICNTQGTSIPRESDGVVYTQAGPEIAVASTKAFLTQIVAAYLVGLYIAQVRGIKFIDEVRDVLDELNEMPEKIERYLETSERLRDLAAEFKSAQSILFLGRHVGFPVALEGALKLKELAYMHAEGFAAGELKHGPIALIEEGTPVLVIMPNPSSPLHDKMLSNVQEIEARGARAIVIASESDTSISPASSSRTIRIPDAPVLFQPLLAVLPLQLFAYESAVIRGYDVDQPRNLAKSVTVE
ncbi:MAG: glutamine--fructose-6-phosphate transaminase (isomerizing) [Actinobacteria bacterium]|nr:glutamine--fructose-6-phosphate transaminase (isomerizing) [Actinomycetota bacterium]